MHYSYSTIINNISHITLLSAGRNYRRCLFWTSTMVYARLTLSSLVPYPKNQLQYSEDLKWGTNTNLTPRHSLFPLWSRRTLLPHTLSDSLTSKNAPWTSSTAKLCSYHRKCGVSYSHSWWASLRPMRLQWLLSIIWYFSVFMCYLNWWDRLFIGYLWWWAWMRYCSGFAGGTRREGFAVSDRHIPIRDR